jgi:hypothetical protein
MLLALCFREAPLISFSAAAAVAWLLVLLS